MLKNSFYNKIKILKELSCVLWFIKKHAKANAKKAKDKKCLKLYEDMEKDLGAHVTMLKDLICKGK